MPGRNLIVVGEVAKPHGLGGEFSLVLHVDSPVFFDHVSRVYLRRDAHGKPRRARVRSWREHNARILLSLEEVRGRDEAEHLRGAELLVSAEEMPPRQDGVILQRELIGVTVVLPDGGFLGRIQTVTDAGGQEVWSIKTNDDTEVLFPAHDRFILQVDLGRGVIRIDPPPGLLDLYLGADQNTGRG